MWRWKDIEEKRERHLSRFRNFLVFDIETVPDEEMLFTVRDEKEIEKFHNEEFLKEPFHRIVAVSLMTIKDKEITQFFSVSSEDETALLNTFWESFKKAHTFVNTKENKKAIRSFPVLISINGKDFDIPVIKARLLKHINNIEDRKFISIFLDSFDRYENDYPNYTYRYSSYHIDIPVDFFGRKMSLKNLCYLSSIPVKQEGDGKDVKNYFKNGDLEKISRYCLEDVKATAKLFAYINDLFSVPELINFPTVEGMIDSIQGEIRVI
ncbi:MAG: hypothetical protein Q9M89_08900 [Persephonella sp.]|nr:hypothetical protein [Persephonella sp.]